MLEDRIWNNLFNTVAAKRYNKHNHEPKEVRNDNVWNNAMCACKQYFYY